MKVKPFRGLRPRKDLSQRIPSYPYDFLDSGEARELVADDPFSFLHVEKPEIDLAPGVDVHDERVYARGRENLRAMIEKGWLERDPEPAFYVYRLSKGKHVQTGIAGVVAVEDYLGDRIRRHEHTRPEKEQDRARHIDTISANAGPILMAYRAIPEMNAIVNGVVAREPRADFTAPDGVGHALWVADDPATCEQIETLFGKIPRAYIADGHHRAAAAVRVAKERGERSGTAPSGAAAAHEYFLAVFFPARQLRILEYNRLVRDLNGLDPASLLERLGRSGFEVKAGYRPRRPKRRGTFAMYLAGDWYLLTPRPDRVPADDPCRGLDVSILAEKVLGPILGIGDPRVDRRIEFVGGGRGPDELERRVDSGDHAVAFVLYPTGMEEIVRVADAGLVLPPKSTWFDPKLRSGMVVHLLD